MNILIIDNYDSFTYNLVHLFAQIKDVNIDVFRNDKVPFDKLDENFYQAVIISPGPGDPNDDMYFGQNNQVLKKYGLEGLPILGVCLGFQGIASFFGASLKQANLPQHGKTSEIDIIKNSRLFTEIPKNIEVMRYHSLMIDTDKPFPDSLIITCEVSADSDSVKANGKEIMAIEHKDLKIYGIQFHPESFATELGEQIAENFIQIVKAKK